MSKRVGPAHVVRIRSRSKGRDYVSTLVRRSFREGGRVRNETITSLTGLPEETIELVERSLKGGKFIEASDAFECVRSLPHGHVAAALGSFKQLELEAVLASRRCRERDLVTAMIISRIVEDEPPSKLGTARSIAEATRWSTLGEELEVTSASEEELYAAMDWLHARQSRIEQKLADRHLSEGSLVLYDVTATYFEGVKCPLATRTSRRGAMKGKLHILIGLLCEPGGRPVAVEVFEGNKGDPKTLATQIEKITKRFRVERVILVGDRGMITEARIEEELSAVDGLSWITALRAPTIKKLLEQGAVTPSLFDKQNLAEISHVDFPHERLIVCLNPLLAESRAKKREELLQATERVLEEIVAATKRKNRPLRGKAEIGIRVGRHINRYKVAKHFKLEIKDRSLRYRRHDVGIEREAALDGIYVIRTDVPMDTMEASHVVYTYKSLARVEAAFRCLKTVDMRVRPIHHRLEHRVRSHVFLCMLAYYVEWHMRNALKTILFHDDDPGVEDRKKTAPVDPAVPSLSAKGKAARKRNSNGDPIHSFATLMKDLSTIARSTMRVKGGEGTRRSGATFVVTTTPTPYQRMVFDLLRLPAPM